MEYSETIQALEETSRFLKRQGAQGSCAPKVNPQAL
jgi:hypothetical protein